MKAYRLDYGRIDAPDKTSHGYLKANAYVTRIGVFDYLLPSGVVRRELRPPEEVFDLNSLATLEEVPVTNDHPPVMLDSKNTKKYAVGFTSNKVDKENIFVKCRMTVTDQDTIDQLQAYEKNETSCGYTCMLEETAGEWNGEKYDAIQRDIAYNHVAIVERGRAGSAVRVHMDSLNGNEFSAGIQVRKDGNDENGGLAQVANGAKADNSSSSPSGADTKQNSKEDIMVKLTLKGKVFDASEELAKAVEETVAEADAKVAEATKATEEATAKVAEAEKAKEELTGKVDALVADAKVKADELAKTIADKPTRADTLKGARARIELENFAKEVLGADAEKMDFDTIEDVEIHKAVVSKVCADAKFDGKSAEYIKGRFDFIKENALDKSVSVKDAIAKIAKGEAKNDEFDLEAARKRQQERTLNGWKTDSK